MSPAPHTAPPEQPHVRLQNLCVARKGRELVRGLTLDVPRGSFVAVVGPSGAGKSSLIETLAGLLQPGSGAITYCCANQCLHEPSNFRHRLGTVFQHFRLTPNASVLTNVLCGALGQHPWYRTLLGFPKKDRIRARKLIADLGLAPHQRRPVARISGGERQRTALARALMQDPELILADEPVSHLDPDLAVAILSKLKTECRDHQRTVFCVLHDPALVDRFADLVLSIDPAHPQRWQLNLRSAEKKSAPDEAKRVARLS